jgi:hypothetical protein
MFGGPTWRGLAEWAGGNVTLRGMSSADSSRIDREGSGAIPLANRYDLRPLP